MTGNGLDVTPIQQYRVTDPRLDNPVFLRSTPPETVISTEDYVSVVSETIIKLVGHPDENKNVEQMETWKFLGWLQTTMKNSIVEKTELEKENPQHQPDDVENIVRKELNNMVKDPSEYTELPEMIIEPAAYIKLTVKAYETLALRLHTTPEQKICSKHSEVLNPFKLPEKIT